MACLAQLAAAELENQVVFTRKKVRYENCNVSRVSHRCADTRTYSSSASIVSALSITCECVCVGVCVSQVALWLMPTASFPLNLHKLLSLSGDFPPLLLLLLPLLFGIFLYSLLVHFPDGIDALCQRHFDGFCKLLMERKRKREKNKRKNKMKKRQLKMFEIVSLCENVKNSSLSAQGRCLGKRGNADV